MIIRRVPIAAALVGCLLALWLAVAPIPATPVPNSRVSAVQAVGITVADMDRSTGFYRDLFGFETVSDRETAVDGDGRAGTRRRIVRMQLGEESVELIQWLPATGRGVPVDSRSNDRWFQHIAIIVNDMDQAYLWLQRRKVETISSSPQRLPDWNPGAGGIRAFYFKDPDGHPLEILEFPPDKGDPRWRRPSDRVFLGIDHTAIVVGDTEVALRFYRDVLGLRVVGMGENWGPEQERLNNVAHAHLRITTLRAATGPGVELLEYLEPRDGRAAPIDARIEDLTHWRTIFTSAPGRTDRAAGAFASPALRDPDGHAVELRADAPARP